MSTVALPHNMISQHGKEVLIINGYKMRFHKMLKNNTKRWCCAKKTCMSYMKTDASGKTVVESHLHHNHELESDGNMLRQMVRNSVKRKAREQIYERPQKLINSELECLKTNSLTKTDINCIRKGIYLARRSLVPKTKPIGIQDVHDLLDSLAVKTLDDEQFLYVNDRRRNVVMFACESNLIALCGARTIYVDNAFECGATFLSQLLTVHGVFDGHCVPLAFFLSNRRQPETYTVCLSALRSECSKLNACFRPELVYADFEESVHAGVRKVWPDIAIKGSRYHLGQAWWRRIQELGLGAQYREETEIGLLLKNVFGLPLLDENHAVECFVEDFMSIIPDDDRINRFMDYLTENFVDSQSDYPPHMWTDMSGNSEIISNACESFRAKLNSLFYKPRTDILSFLKILKKIQIDTKISIRTLIDCPHKMKSTTDQRKINFIEENIIKYQTGTITRLHFVKLMAFKNQPRESKKML